MRILCNSYPEGKRRAMTFSYDDGREYDRKLARIFDENGLRASFHLNSAFLGTRESYLTPEELPKLFKNHEISVHTATHPWLTAHSNESILREVMEDRRTLEAAAGYPVRGMSYPFGDYDERVISVLRACGIVCSRTVLATNKFTLPADFLMWHPTCHHNGPLNELLDTFLKVNSYTTLRCFFIWGHSYEFNNNGNWNLIEEFAKRASGDPDTWYATNIEIYDYVTAVRSIQFGVDDKLIHNPSALDVWVTADNEPVKISSGQTVRF
ncbi:MAG: polysaccharide deacetylase family protein [Clostridiaceae bacterium]|nr:polysaccharide deacetylase family protein [Clostridiaceae bacterium]